MPLFSNLADRIRGYTLQLTITLEDGIMTVLVYPQVSEKEEVQNKIVPVAIKGTPTELDQTFIASLGTKLDKTKEIARQIKNFEKGLDKAVEAAAKDSKTSISDATKKSDKVGEDIPSKADRVAGGSEPKMEFDKDGTNQPAEEKKPDPDIEKADKDTGEIPKPTAASPPVAAAAPEPEPEPETPETPKQEAESDEGEAQAPDQDSFDDPDEEW